GARSEPAEEAVGPREHDPLRDRRGQGQAQRPAAAGVLAHLDPPHELAGLRDLYPLREPQRLRGPPEHERRRETVGDLAADEAERARGDDVAAPGRTAVGEDDPAVPLGPDGRLLDIR